MFTLLESKKEIAKAHANLASTIESNFTHKSTKNIGYPGGTTHDANVNTDRKHWFWSSDYKKETPNPRKLNWFGLFSENAGLQIAVEINTPYVGANGQVAGFFARNNESGKVYLLHSGRVGGGTKGVGKFAFLTWSNHLLVPATDSFGKIRNGVVVMPVSGAGATRSAIRYVDTIVRFKEAVRAGEIGTPEFQEKLKKFEGFYSESSGRRTAKRSGKIDYFSRHGDVVDALYTWRSGRGELMQSRIVKNAQIDLGVECKNALTEVYEVKTSATRTDVYTAIGQLMVHADATNCKKFIVLPSFSQLPSDILSAFHRLDIQLLEFELSASEAWIC